VDGGERLREAEAASVGGRARRGALHPVDSIWPISKKVPPKGPRSPVGRGAERRARAPSPRAASSGQVRRRDGARTTSPPRGLLEVGEVVFLDRRAARGKWICRSTGSLFPLEPIGVPRREEYQSRPAAQSGRSRALWRACRPAASSRSTLREFEQEARPSHVSMPARPHGGSTIASCWMTS